MLTFISTVVTAKMILLCCHTCTCISCCPSGEQVCTSGCLGHAIMTECWLHSYGVCLPSLIPGVLGYVCAWLD